MATLLDCIERIPGCLKGIRDSYPVRAEGIANYLSGEGIKNVNRLVIIASGSSYNSAHAAKLFIQNQCGIEVELKYPNMFVHYEARQELKNAKEDTVYAVISQGGETLLVYKALELIRAAKKPCIAITAGKDTSISKLAGYHEDMGCGQEEFLYRTIGFSTSVSVCCFMGLAAGVYNGFVTKEKEREFLIDFDAMIQNLLKIRQETCDWYQTNKFSLLKRNKMMIAGTGDLYPIANEGDIKVMEMVPMMTRSFELEEFIHGPQNAFDDDTIFMILCRNGDNDEKAKAIARFIKEQIGFCALVGEEPMDKRDLCIKPASLSFFGLEYVTVFQTLAYYMATDRGRDLRRGVNMSINRYITKTL